jgi:ribonuclease E
MKRILINATQKEELRVAMVDGQKLYDLDIEVASKIQKKNNIYKGTITRVEPSLDSVFVDFGSGRNGFLPVREISKEYFLTQPVPGEKQNIKNLLKEGQEIVIQVVKEERGNKGAALTTFLSLAGRFVVLMPNNPKGGGISRKITGKDRTQTLASLDNIEIPKDVSMIIRTAGVGRDDIELQWDLNYLMEIWNSIKELAIKTESPALIFQENNLIVRAMRDHLDDDIGEIIIDDESTYKDAKKYIKQITPKYLRKLKSYKDSTPLFTKFQIENQIESAYANEVILPSGGTVVIDFTEALVSIDINSGKATKGADIEATAVQTNIEAAEEIARQCRLRDMGGLLVIDFIDMRQYKNQKIVVNTLRSAVKQDRARISIGNVSKFGLVEMSRQRLRPSLGDSAYRICSNCSGVGKVRSTESLALSILRLVGEEARKEYTESVVADIPSDAATYLLNEKREWIKAIEEREGISVVLMSNAELSSANFSLKRVRKDEHKLPANKKATFKLMGSANNSHQNSTKNNETKNDSEVLDSKYPPLTAWDVDGVKSPNIIDRFKFWISTTSRKKTKQTTKRTSTKRNNRKSKINNKAKSNSNRKRKPTSNINKSKRKAPVKKAENKAPGKKIDRKAPGKKAENKAPGKKIDRKAPGKKAENKSKKTFKDSNKLPKDIKKPKREDLPENNNANNQRVLPWEDIIPPKS